MLKALSARCSSHVAFGAHVRRYVPVGEPASPLLRRILGQNKRSLYIIRRFCSDSTDGSDPDDASAPVKSGDDAAESKSSSAIVPTLVRPEDCLTVVALPLSHRPLFPGFYMPVYVKDPKLLAALIESRKRQAPYTGAFLLKDEEGTDGSDSEKNIYDLKGKDLFNRLHEIGTLAQITSIQGDQVVLIGHRRLRITEMVSEDPLTVKVDHLKEIPYDKDDDILKATSFEVISTLRDVLKTSPLWRDHAQTYIQHVGDFTYPRVADFGAAISGANKQQCQQVLEELDVHKRLKLTLELVKKEMEISKIQESIAKAIEEKISGEQRRYLLNEQLKAIKKELGLETDDKTALSAKFRERLDPKKEKIPAHVLQVIEEELTKLQLLEASSSEFNVTRNYLDWLTALPWGEYSDENFDVLRAQEILDEDHYGLTDVKERILEFIAVGKLRGTSQGKIVCLSGPPGVGKTSIGRSIARALNRKFYRFSVGGLSDVAEIKGHRRTYIGAMPGKMVQCLKSVGTANPLVLIDEIDKLGRGHAGDPASAMLELLDPEQNANFLDHYLDVPIDLSKVLFVCTANVVEMIPNPLLDRMEVISIAGYITDEKMHIARDYLEKATREACGIKSEQVTPTLLFSVDMQLYISHTFIKMIVSLSIFSCTCHVWANEDHTHTRIEREREREREREMSGERNGHVEESTIMIPKVKFTKLFINGEFVDSVSGKTFETIDPRSEEVIGKVAEGDKEDVDLAVKAAREAFDHGPWPRLPGSERRKIMLKFADLIEQNLEELAALDAMDAANLYLLGKIVMINNGIELFRYYAGAADKIHGETLKMSKQLHGYTLLEPIGVVGHIIPWNFPTQMFSMKVAPALAAGCTMVVKPAEQTPLSALFYAHLAKLAGVPDGVLNVVTGYGSTVGAAISSHMDIDMVSFTGSTVTGHRIMQAAATSNLKQVCLELGGKSPFIVFDDVDVDKTAPLALNACLYNQGQICVAGTRVFVQEGIYDKFVGRLLEQLKTWVVGDPFDPNVNQGPQVDKKQYEKVLSYIEVGKKEGATLLTGGKPLDRKGYFIEPTIFTDVTDDMTIAKDEIFGPVMSIMKFKSMEEVIKRANNTKYGLAAGIMTNNLNTANTVSRSIRAGTIWINCYFAFDNDAPMGGYKMSGFGKDMGINALHKYLHVKSIATPIYNSPWL